MPNHTKPKYYACIRDGCEMVFNHWGTCLDHFHGKANVPQCQGKPWHREKGEQRPKMLAFVTKAEGIMNSDNPTVIQRPLDWQMPQGRKHKTTKLKNKLRISNKKVNENKQTLKQLKSSFDKERNEWHTEMQNLQNKVDFLSQKRACDDATWTIERIKTETEKTACDIAVSVPQNSHMKIEKHETSKEVPTEQYFQLKNNLLNIGPDAGECETRYVAAPFQNDWSDVRTSSINIMNNKSLPNKNDIGPSQLPVWLRKQKESLSNIIAVQKQTILQTNASTKSMQIDYGNSFGNSHGGYNPTHGNIHTRYGGYSHGYAQPQTYAQPQAYGQTQTYSQPQAYGQPQTYSQPQNYQSQAYGQPQTYSQPQSYQPQAYGHPETYGQPQSYGQSQTYGQLQTYDEPQAYRQL